MDAPRATGFYGACSGISCLTLFILLTKAMKMMNSVLHEAQRASWTPEEGNTECLKTTASSMSELTIKQLIKLTTFVSPQHKMQVTSEAIVGMWLQKPRELLQIAETHQQKGDLSQRTAFLFIQCHSAFHSTARNTCSRQHLRPPHQKFQAGIFYFMFQQPRSTTWGELISAPNWSYCHCHTKGSSFYMKIVLAGEHTHQLTTLIRCTRSSASNQLSIFQLKVWSI